MAEPPQNVGGSALTLVMNTKQSALSLMEGCLILNSMLQLLPMSVEQSSSAVEQSSEWNHSSHHISDYQHGERDILSN